MNSHENPEPYRMLSGREDVDIYTFPTMFDDVQNHNVATLGDLHGNSTKLLFALNQEKEKIVTTSSSNYEGLVSDYNGNHNKETIEGFKNKLGGLNAADTGIGLRLVGDDVADRGRNDLLTLLAYERLDQLRVPQEIIVSNHGAEFLKQYAAGIAGDLSPDFVYQGANQAFGTSLHGLRQSIQDGVVSVEEVERLIEKHYLPKIKLLSYDLSDPALPIVYSHAPVTMGGIQAVANIFGVEFNHEPPTELAKTIDRINQAFSEILMDKNKLAHFYSEANAENYSVFDNFVNDRYEDLTNKARPDNAPALSYYLYNIHGHVGEVVLATSPEPNFIYVNLDSNLGKGAAFNKGRYDAFHSKENNHQLTYTAVQEAKQLSTHALLRKRGFAFVNARNNQEDQLNKVPPKVEPQSDLNKKLKVDASNDDQKENVIPVDPPKGTRLG